MTPSSALALLVAVLVAAFVALASPVRDGQATATCSIGATDYERAGLQTFSNAPNLVLATVTSERSIPQPPNRQEMWESVVQVEVVLKGDAPVGQMTIPYIGFFGGDCTGGPRLREGERVLIPVYWGVASYGDGREAWQLHGIFSKLLIEDDEATVEWAAGAQPVGDAREAVRRFAQAAEADDAEIDEALAALDRPPAPPPSSNEAPVPSSNDRSDPTWLYPLGAVVAVALIAGGFVVWRAKRAGAG